jgi:uroporphyrinogen decarboxylase
VDVLNPIQPLCPGMAPRELKREFGKRLSFMGGLDTQEFLVRATPAAVERHSHALVCDMSAAGGGYIFAASHTIQPDTPLANVLALSKAVQAR